MPSDDETTPLVARDSVARDNVARDRRNWWSLPTFWLTIFLNFLLFSGQAVALAPRMQMYENVICQHFSSRDSTVHGARCKDADVQAELAFVLGMEEFLTGFLSFLSIPYSFVANRYGYAPVLSLSLFGIALELAWPFFVCSFARPLPIYWVWLGIAFEIIGGGITVTVTMFNLIVLGFASHESRTRILLFLTANTLISTAIGRFVSTKLMRTNLWLPAYIGCGFNVLAIVVSFALSRATAKPTAHRPPTGIRGQDEPSPVARSATEVGIDLLRELGATLKGNPHIFLVLCAAFAFPLGEDSMFTVVLLYISKRYGWSIGDANFLVACSTVLQLSTFLIVVPGVGYLLVKHRGVTSYVRDRILVQAQGILLLVGALSTALAPTVVLAFGGLIIMSFGMAVVTVLRSLVTDLVRPQDVALVYSMLTMMMRIGSAVAGPIFAWSFGFGIKLGPNWTGLPFIFAAVFFFVGTATLVFLPKEPWTKDGEETDGDNDLAQET